VIGEWFSRLAGRSATSASDGPPPRPPFAEQEDAMLASAREWLDAATRTHARALALGEERTYHVDQDAGRLTLLHADGFKLEFADVQILASFKPEDGSLRWSWANSSVDPRRSEAARAARDQAATSSFASLREPTFKVKFEDCVGLVALAARLSEQDGVYRCLVDGSLSVFVAYKLAHTTPGPSSHPALESLEAEAAALIDRYDAEMLPIDHEHNARPPELTIEEDSALASRLLARKLAVYRRYWSRTDAYWEPASFGDPSDHAPSTRLRRFTLPCRAGGVYVVTQRRPWHSEAHVVQDMGGTLKITDMDLDWGQGLLLFGSPSAA
jgi:hypothetical protein